MQKQLRNQLRIAREDIQIAKLDKRKRYGLAAVGVIPKGTVFKYTPGDYADLQPAHVFVQGGWGPIGSEVAKKVEAMSEVMPLTSWADYSTCMDIDRSASAHIKLIEEMISRGMLTLEDVIRVHEEQQAREANEEQN